MGMVVGGKPVFHTSHGTVTNSSQVGQYSTNPVTRWLPWADKYGHEYGTPPAYILAEISHESGGNPDAWYGHPGATAPNYGTSQAAGLGQFLPSTWKGLNMGGSRFNPVLNIKAMAKYLSMLKQESGSWSAAIGHYHGLNPQADAQYAATIQGMAGQYEGLPGSVPIPSAVPAGAGNAGGGTGGSTASTSSGAIGGFFHHNGAAMGGGWTDFLINLHKAESPPQGSFTVGGLFTGKTEVEGAEWLLVKAGLLVFALLIMLGGFLILTGGAEL